MNKIIPEVYSLSKDVFGNYVVQHLLEIVSKNKKDRYQIITKIFEILKNNQIKTRLVDHLNDDYSIIIGVDDTCLNNTISSLYNGFNNMRLI